MAIYRVRLAGSFDGYEETKVMAADNDYEGAAQRAMEKIFNGEPKGDVVLAAVKNADNFAFTSEETVLVILESYVTIKYAASKVDMLNNITLTGNMRNILEL